jgi:hypothetical protein
MAVRDEVRELLEAMPEEELLATQRYIEFLRSGYTDPVLWLLDTAPEDDEPTTPEEEEAVAESREQIRRGETISMEEIKRRYLS